MADHYPDIDELLAKQLAGEASPEEVAAVDDWLDDSAANRRYFANLQQLWEQPEPEPGAEAVLLKVKAKLHKPPLHVATSRRLSRWMLGTAAALAALLIAALFLLTPDPAAGARPGRSFVFDATPLSRAVEQLEQTYGIDIVVQNAVLNDCLLDGAYADEGAVRVLELIAETFSLTLTREGERFVLDGTGCGEE